MSLISRVEYGIAQCAPMWLTSLVLRLGLAVPFWKSGLTKWDGFGKLSETPLLLFENEFKLNILGQQYDYPFPVLMAYASSIAEIVLPILLVIGLLTRFAALGLLVMTLVIQLTFPDGWPVHITWAAMALGVMYLGGQRLSADRFLWPR
jgi:putative oxidoreductase